jgi:hypothetical protein
MEQKMMMIHFEAKGALRKHQQRNSRPVLGIMRVWFPVSWSKILRTIQVFWTVTRDVRLKKGREQLEQHMIHDEHNLRRFMNCTVWFDN